MTPTKVVLVALVSAATVLMASGCGQNGAVDPEEGFVSLFDGTSLAGWHAIAPSGAADYSVRDGVIVFAQGGKGNLLTQKEYSDFIFRFEFRLQPGSNNGVGIRSPLTGTGVASHGMEIQILDDTDPKYADLKPWQFHGSLYGIAPAKRGSLLPVGDWNEMEVSAVGRQIRIAVNGQIVVDQNINDVTDREVIRKHPGMFRERGHVGFLGHDDYIELRNIRIKDLSQPQPVNEAPHGFVALFNGRDLSGWQGLVESPPARAALSAAELQEKQAAADALMRQNWVVRNEALAYTGDGFDNLCTEEAFGDFELHLDWKIEPGSDSGVYLRGTPQVQIWDKPEEGSGALWNNQDQGNKPLKVADRPPGEWNRMKIVMVGEHVSVLLNEEVVISDVPLENFWERGRPIYPTGPIELQAHTDPIEFRSVYVRRLD